MPVVNGWDAFFLFEGAAPGLDEAMLNHVVHALAGKGYTATPIRRGSSGMEACVTVSRGSLRVAICCELSGPECESQLDLWHVPPWFWERILGRDPLPGEVDEALGEIREAASSVLDASSSVSRVVWRTTKESAAHFIQQAQRKTNA